MDIVKKIAFILLIIGGLNWGLFGLFGDAGDLVAYLPDALATVVYILVGVSALVVAFTGGKCSSGGSKESASEPMTQSQPQEPMSGAQM
jgi:uncharacterized membrane protein YuzA (DUF378 family)